MKAKTKFITNFFFVESDQILEYLGMWMVFDMESKRFRPRYGKKLKELLPFKEKFKKPVFFFLIPMGTSFYIPITLINERTGLELTFLATPDSGASISAFSYEIGEALGVNFKKDGEKISSYLGQELSKVTAYSVELTFRISNDKHAFAAQVDFLMGKKQATLCGLNALFSHYEVVFNPKLGIKYRFIK